MMLDPKGLEAACAATVLGEDEYEKPVHLEPREAETAIRAYLSTVTPAEVGGHADAQTEARAIAIAAAGQVHDNEDARCVETLVERLVATALAARDAAKDAELAAVKAERDALRNEAAELVVVQYEVSALKADRDNLAECNALIGQDLREALDRAEGAEAQLAEAQEELNVLRANQIAHVEARARLTDQLAEARKALSVAVDRIMENEPGDSRAVSPLAVSLAAVSCGVADQACWAVIDDAARRALEAQGGE